MSDLNNIDYENPRLDTLKELYSHQDRECWMCKKYAAKLEAGEDLKEEELWHFTNCVMAWEEINHECSHEDIISDQILEKAA